MITLYRLLEIYGIDPTKIGLVRHGNKEMPILETFAKNLERLEAYQSFQGRGKFEDSQSIAVFAAYHKTTALFLGLWDIHGHTETSEFTDDTLSVLRDHNLPEDWFNHSIRYDLRRNPILDDLSERLVIEWGPQPIRWFQTKDKEVIEIKAKNSIGEFQSFDEVSLDFQTLSALVKSPETNLTWKKALSSVNGIYLIQDKSSGKLYVGSAYGEGGIYGRWDAYTKGAHSRISRLRDLDPQYFQFSILEIIPATTSWDDVIDRENRWKEKLSTRQFGLNEN